MKKIRSILSVALALFSAGCISVLPEPKHAPARYDVALPADPAAESTKASEQPGAIYVVGRVRTSEEALGRDIRTIDLETGRTGILPDGQLARSPEAIIGSFLRARLATRHPSAIVCDETVAPRGGKRTTIKAWIERFRLEKKHGAWSFTAHIRFFTESPDGSVTLTDATPSVPVVPADGIRPTAAETVAAISQALASIE